MDRRGSISAGRGTARLAGNTRDQGDHDRAEKSLSRSSSLLSIDGTMRMRSSPSGPPRRQLWGIVTDREPNAQSPSDCRCL